MQNYILINRTYIEITPESAEDAYFSDNGYLSENEAVTFSELVELMKRHPQASQWPNNGSLDVWYSTGYQVENYGTGTEREECLHFHPDNTANVAKYWKLAAKIAGHIK